MRNRLMLLGLLVAAAILAGCGKTTKPSDPLSGGPAAATDKAAVGNVLSQNPNAVDEDVFSTGLATDVTADMGFAAITPLHFWRTITDVDRTFDFQFSAPDSSGRPTMALVTVNKHLTGTFNVAFGDTTATDTSIQVAKKPLDDHWERHLLLHRVERDSMHAVEDEQDGDDGWRLVGISGVEVTSKNAVTAISSVRIQAGALDTTITDPLQLHRLRRFILIPDLTHVTVTVTTHANDDVVVFFGNDSRRRFHNNGDDTYTFSWTTSDFPGFRHFGVNALSHGTLFDDTAPYDSQAWVVPFVVRDTDEEIEHD